VSDKQQLRTTVHVTGHAGNTLRHN